VYVQVIPAFEKFLNAFFFAVLACCSILLSDWIAQDVYSFANKESDIFSVLVGLYIFSLHFCAKKRRKLLPFSSCITRSGPCIFLYNLL